jgi:hypothetical protein
LPEHRAAHLAAIAGKRGKRYFKRQQVLEVGEAAVSFLTEVVHRNPQGWIGEVDQLHLMLQELGPQALHRAGPDRRHAIHGRTRSTHPR